MTVEAFAPAKINLTLHVTGRRADGYHLLDSLVVFADVGDRISVSAAETTSLTVTGPLSDGVPTDESNLVLRAAKSIGVPAAITLEKDLPAAAGIGGGSSDAAATLRALSELGGVPVPDDRGLSLGADVPVCTMARASRMAGIGEEVSAVDGLPDLPAVLVNPRFEVPTPSVFRALKSREIAPMGTIPFGADFGAFCGWIDNQRNDLEPAALAVDPRIKEPLDALQNARIARMSGSGATCFGLYETDAQAAMAAEQLRLARPDWWVVQTRLS